MTKYVFFGLIAIILIAQIDQFHARDLIFVACGCIAYIYNRLEPNISSLILILVCIKAVEILCWQFLNMSNAYLAYPVIIVLDVTALFFIAKRNKILVKLEYRRTGKVTPYKYLYSNADYTLGLIYKTYLALTVFMLLEHLLRHPDDLGLPVEWTLNIRYVYDAYPTIKMTLNIFEYVAILATAHKLMRSERYVTA